MTATTELVVPKSIPIALAISTSFLPNLPEVYAISGWKAVQNCSFGASVRVDAEHPTNHHSASFVATSTTITNRELKRLAIMHGSRFEGDGERALGDLAAGFKEVFGRLRLRTAWG